MHGALTCLPLCDGSQKMWKGRDGADAEGHTVLRVRDAQAVQGNLCAEREHDRPHELVAPRIDDFNVIYTSENSVVLYRMGWSRIPGFGVTARRCFPRDCDTGHALQVSEPAHSAGHVMHFDLPRRPDCQRLVMFTYIMCTYNNTYIYVGISMRMYWP